MNFRKKCWMVNSRPISSRACFRRSVQGLRSAPRASNFRGLRGRADPLAWPATGARGWSHACVAPCARAHDRPTSGAPHRGLAQANACAAVSKRRRSSAACHRSGRHDVGLGKIIAFEEQRLPRQRRQGVRETVAEVQTGGMAPPCRSAAKRAGPGRPAPHRRRRSRRRPCAATSRARSRPAHRAGGGGSV